MQPGFPEPWWPNIWGFNTAYCFQSNTILSVLIAFSKKRRKIDPKNPIIFSLKVFPLSWHYHLATHKREKCTVSHQSFFPLDLSLCLGRNILTFQTPSPIVFKSGFQNAFQSPFWPASDPCQQTFFTIKLSQVFAEFWLVLSFYFFSCYSSTTVQHTWRNESDEEASCDPKHI